MSAFIKLLQGRAEHAVAVFVMRGDTCVRWVCDGPNGTPVVTEGPCTDNARFTHLVLIDESDIDRPIEELFLKAKQIKDAQCRQL